MFGVLLVNFGVLGDWGHLDDEFGYDELSFCNRRCPKLLRWADDLLGHLGWPWSQLWSSALHWLANAEPTAVEQVKTLTLNHQ